MSEPEIARRCAACGAAVRGRARFCPQCGRRVAEVELPPHIPTPEEENGKHIDPMPESRVDEVAASPKESEPAHKIMPASGNLRRGADTPDAPTTTLNLPGEAPTKPRRVVVQEKLRDTSSVVLDGASEDSGLRFVLVAALIFLLFIIFLIISKLLG